MIAALIIGALASLALAYVAAPLRRGSTVAVQAERDDPLDDRKRMALGAIVELEDDRVLGKLSEKDFASLRADYDLEAIAALREIDSARDVAEVKDDDLEGEIAALRASMVCGNCGALMSGDRCARCGA